MSKKTIAVVGATGAQGHGLVRAIVEDSRAGFGVRALTRDPNSPRAKALAALGAEVVAANVDEPESLRPAFEGAYGAYCVTFYWDHFSPERELAQAGNLARAAKDAALQHVIWSTLEDTRKLVPLEDERMPTLMGRYKVPHFDAKGEADALFTGLGVPTTFLHASFYWDNFIHFGMGPKKGTDGTYQLVLPIGDSRMAGIAAEDIGRCAYGMFKRGPGLIGQHVGVAGGQLTGREMAEEMSKALGRRIVFNAVTPAVYRGFGFPGSEDLGNMFQVYAEFERELNATRDVARSRQLNPQLQSFTAWLEANKDRIPIEG